jgi:putative transposase
MSVAAGLAVMQAMFEAEITAIAGPRSKHNPQRTAVRHGTGRGSVTLGGRRVPVSRPRARTTDGHATGDMLVSWPRSPYHSPGHASVAG